MTKGKVIVKEYKGKDFLMSTNPYYTGREHVYKCEYMSTLLKSHAKLARPKRFEELKIQSKS